MIETNPLLTDFDEYIGSDYLFEKIDFDPEYDIMRLGDAYYDTRVVMQEVMEQTGQRYLQQGIGSELEQMSVLLNNAASMSEALNLSVGISLTAEQVANLTADIVWWESIEMDGQLVLAPKLYLSNLTPSNFSGGVVAGGDISIDAAELNNSNNIASDGRLHIAVENDLLNDKGQLSARGDLLLQAGNDIRNISGQISTSGDNSKLSLIAGNNIVNQTWSYQEETADLVHTKLGQSATIFASGDLLMQAGNDLTSIAGNISGQQNVQLAAGNAINLLSIEDRNVTLQHTSQGRGEKLNTEIVANNISSGGDLSFVSGGDFTSEASSLQSGNNLTINSGGELLLLAKQQQTSSNLTSGSGETSSKQITHATNQLSVSNNLTLVSNKGITLEGAKLNIGNDAVLSAKDDINILAVNDSNYNYSEETHKKSFGRSKTTIHESYVETVNGSEVNAGGDITIQAQHLSSGIVAGNDSNIYIVGSALNADGAVNLSADGDVVLAAQQYKEYERNETKKSGFLGLSSKHTGSIDDATLLNGAYVLTGSDINISSGANINILASEVVADGNVNIDALDEVLIAAGEVLRKSEQWDESMSLFSGTNLFEMETAREGIAQTSAQSSAIASQGDLNINAGNIKVIGSDLSTQANANLSADTGEIEILAAAETTSSYSNEEQISVGLGDMSEMVSVDDGKIKIKLGEATYDKVDTKTDNITQRGSSIVANNNITLDAATDILIEGSDLIADAEQDKQGDISLTAVESIIIKEATESSETETEEVHGTAEVSVVVQHQAAEVVKAVLALKEATDSLKSAKSEYKQYKKQLSSLEGTLSKLEQELTDKVPGVNYEDVEELQDLIEQVKSDEAWYVAGIALAVVDVTSKTTSLVQQGAAAAQSTGTWGFNAGLQLDIEASKTQSQQKQTTSLASNLTGQNISINAGNEAGNQALIQGSNLQANDSVSIAANEVNIIASQESQSSKSQTESGSISASVTLYGASSGINLNASLNRSEDTSNSTTHTNSTINADNITIISKADTNIIGGNVDADSELNLTVGGDLKVASVQDRENSSHKGAGISAGLSLSGGDVPTDKNGNVTGMVNHSADGSGDVTGASGGLNASSGRTSSKQTILSTLTSGGNANIKVAGNTELRGALLATLDEEGNDLGNLNLETETFSYVDLSNTHYDQNQSVGINTSVGVNEGELDATSNSTSVQYQNSLSYGKSKTLATLGTGNINIADSENSTDISRLNRDTANTEKDLFEVDRQQGNIDVTLDHQLLTEEGREQIEQDFSETGKGMQKIDAVLPSAQNDNEVLATLGSLLDTVGKWTGGVVPSDANNGGLISQVPVLLGQADDAHVVDGNLDSKNVYMNGIMNTKQDAIEGADNIIGSEVDKMIWLNPTHGVAGDILESAVDLVGNMFGLQTGISKQAQEFQENHKDMNYFLHSQAHLIAKEGAKPDENTYNSFGGPLPSFVIKDTFNITEPNKNDGDYVAKPLNVLWPPTWFEYGHGTEHYGDAVKEK